MDFYLKVWRQKNAAASGEFMSIDAKDISPDTSFLEMIDIVNRSLATGTRLLFDRKLKQAGVAGERITGYDHEVSRHMDVGLEILSGRADAGPGIRPVASLLGLDFLSLRQERYDLLVTRERFFDQGIQYFLSLLHEKAFIRAAENLEGYDVSKSGKMIFPYELEADAELKST